MVKVISFMHGHCALPRCGGQAHLHRETRPTVVAALKAGRGRVQVLVGKQ